MKNKRFFVFITAAILGIKAQGFAILLPNGNTAENGKIMFSAR